MSKCDAKQFSDQMSCACGNVWDMNDPDPPECRKIPDMTTNRPEVKRYTPAHSVDSAMRGRLFMEECERGAWVLSLEDYEDLQAKCDALAEALEWYLEQVLGCRKITSEGEQYRTALDRDGGARARAALAAHRQQQEIEP